VSGGRGERRGRDEGIKKDAGLGGFVIRCRAYSHTILDPAAVSALIC